MTLTQAISLDVAREQVLHVYAKQFDSNSRKLLVSVLENGVEQTLTTGSVTLNARRPDGSTASFAGSISNGKALLPIDSWVLEQYGTVYCSCSIVDSGAKLTTLSFRMVVERAEGGGWILVYTASSALSAGNYYITISGVNYQFTTTQTIPVGGKIYFNAATIGAKSVDASGADIESLTLTIGTTGTQLVGSDVVNFIAALLSEISSFETTMTAALADKLDIADGIYIIKITAQNTTLGDIASTLATVNAAGEHVLFDTSALGAQSYLCTVFIDTNANVYKVLDLVNGKFIEGTYASTTLLTLVLAQMSGLATQAQVNFLQEEIDHLGGGSTFDNLDALADLIESGDSPDKISEGDDIPLNWLTAAAGTCTNGGTVTVSDLDKLATGLGEAEQATYLLVYDGTKWTYQGEQITLSDFGVSVSGTLTAGDVLTIGTTVRTDLYTFTSYDTVEANDAGVSHNWLLEKKYAPSTEAYDSRESLFCVQAGKSVAAGKYYLPLLSYRSNGTFNLCFELSSAIGGASKIQLFSNSTSGNIPNASGTTVNGVYYPTSMQAYAFGTTTTIGSAIAISILSTANATAGGYTDITSLNTDPSDPVIAIGDLDASQFGLNNWALSNVRYRLNNADKVCPWTPTHDNDRAGAASSGFLYGLDPRAKAIIIDAKVKFTAGYGAPGYTRNTTYTSVDKVFLLSMNEMGFATINTSEGVITDLYKTICGGSATDSAVGGRAKYNYAGGTKNSYRWSRSAFTSYSYLCRVVSSTGASGGNYAGNGYFVAPAFCIGKNPSNP